MKVVVAVALVALAAVAPARGQPKPNPVLLHPSKLHQKAPDVFEARFHTSKGAFVVTVHRSWAPAGADRFYDLVSAGFYDGDRIFRVVPGFVAQWGINPSPKVSHAWRNAQIEDDARARSNVWGTVSFATTGAPDSRSTQVFVNLGNNAALDQAGYVPFGKVTSGIRVLYRLFAGYGEQPTARQSEMLQQGEKFLAETFPKLDRIVSAEIVKPK